MLSGRRLKTSNLPDPIGRERTFLPPSKGKRQAYGYGRRCEVRSNNLGKTKRKSGTKRRNGRREHWDLGEEEKREREETGGPSCSGMFRKGLTGPHFGSEKQSLTEKKKPKNHELGRSMGQANGEW